MTWALDMDDFRNICGRGEHSMMRVISIHEEQLKLKHYFIYKNQVIYNEMKDYEVPEPPPIPTSTEVCGNANSKQ